VTEFWASTAGLVAIYAGVFATVWGSIWVTYRVWRRWICRSPRAKPKVDPVEGMVQTVIRALEEEREAWSLEKDFNGNGCLRSGSTEVRKDGSVYSDRPGGITGPAMSKKQLQRIYEAKKAWLAWKAIQGLAPAPKLEPDDSLSALTASYDAVLAERHAFEAERNEAQARAGALIVEQGELREELGNSYAGLARVESSNRKLLESEHQAQMAVEEAEQAAWNANLELGRSRTNEVGLRESVRLKEKAIDEHARQNLEKTAQNTRLLARVKELQERVEHEKRQRTPSLRARRDVLCRPPETDWKKRYEEFKEEIDGHGPMPWGWVKDSRLAAQLRESWAAYDVLKKERDAQNTRLQKQVRLQSAERLLLDCGEANFDDNICVEACELGLDEDSTDPRIGTYEVPENLEDCCGLYRIYEDRLELDYPGEETHVIRFSETGPR